MKKVFSAIGLLLMFFSFSIYFTLTEQGIYFLSYDYIYFIELNDEFIEIRELEEIATVNDVMLANRQILNSAVGKTHIKHRVINPTSSIKEGIQKSIFRTGKKEIEFIDENNSENFRKIFVYAKSENEYKNTVQMIKDRGYDVSTYKTQEMNITVEILFSDLFMKFCMFIGILSIIAIVSYYVYRLKEIGILRMNGWSSKQISNRIMRVMVRQTSIYFFIPMGVISIYVLIADYHLIRNFVFISFLLFGCQLMIYYISNLIASITISKINCVSAVKNKKNNRSFFIFLTCAKVLTVFLLIMQTKSINEGIVVHKDINKAYERLEENDLYHLEQREPLGAEYCKIINSQMENISDSEIYNYYIEPEKNEYSSSEIKELKRKGSIRDYNNCIYCSYNFVPLLRVKDISGRYINNVYIEEMAKGEKVCVMLIPAHYINEVANIKKSLYIDSNYDIVKYYFIEDNQVYNSYKSNDTFCYDSIIVIRKMYKEISGSTFLTKKGKEIFENILISNGISKHTVYARGLAEANEEAKSINDIQLLRNAMCMVLVVLAYIIVTFSIITIYFEIRKKRIGVYVLQGKYPLKDILGLIIMNIIIVTAFSMKFNKQFLLVNIAEIVIYIYMVFMYLKNKAILAIKGK